MHVIATAGHVDHGKSTLVRALTGSDPDRLEEEHERGLSIELGYCWTSLPPAGDVAFVDVPGHERFISTMLSGIGPVPAVLFVVAADDPWMPQAAEHLAALDALGVSHGVLAVTRSDLVDPGPALARARAEMAGTSLCDAPAVAVSGRTGAGLNELRSLLADMVCSLPAPDPGADVRLWVDRSFHIKGAGTVVTGTLPGGRIAIGDSLAFGPETLRVRGMQSLSRTVESATGVARVALNITGAGVEELHRGSVLVTPGAWLFTDVVDVRTTHHSSGSRVPERPLLHIGATSVATHFRPLAPGLARITLDHPLPLRIGDRTLLRDPGIRAVWGVIVLDPAPTPLARRRGAAAALASTLADLDGRQDLATEVARRGMVRRSLLRRIGLDIAPLDAESPSEEEVLVSGDWVLSADRAADLREQMHRIVDEHNRAEPLAGGVSIAAIAQALDLPELDLVSALIATPLRMLDGRVAGTESPALPAYLERALTELSEELVATPFAAPTADRLHELGLDTKAIGAAAKAGRLIRLAPGIVLLPGADQLAVTRLAALPQPFTTSEARVRLGTTRRVILPLLAYLDRSGATRWLPDDRRAVCPPSTMS